MRDANAAAPIPQPTQRAWPGYGAVWRWHFYAGLFCLPFVLWLAVTGSIYLFRPQIEALLDGPYAHLALTGPRSSAAAQAAAAVRAVPGSVLHRYQLPDTPTQAVQVIVGRGAAESRVYVHPQTLAILKVTPEEQRPMRVVFRLHGELLIGDTGSYLVELAASWTIVMILTGLVLWWPRTGGIAGVLYPRLTRNGRPFWRDLHGVVGFWVSAFALLFLLSGLPWAKSWGGYLKTVRSVAVEPVRQDWSIGHADEMRAHAAMDAGMRQMMSDHAEHGGMTMAHPLRSYAPLDQLVATVQPLRLAPPVLIAPPTTNATVWTAKSDAADRPLRTDLTLDGRTGVVVSRREFGARPLADRIVGYGVAGHEGQLFGWANQLLNLTVALGLVTMTVSGTILWWRRRPSGRLGAPPAPAAKPLAIGFAALVVGLGVLLPLFGASLLVVLVLDRLILRRLTNMRRWLGF